MTGFGAYAKRCPHRLLGEQMMYHPGGTALRVEPMPIAPRCIQQRPAHWPESATALRWLGSGGEITVFGHCSAESCPLQPNHCTSCGHMAHSHIAGMCRVDADGWPCGCESKTAEAQPEQEDA